MKQAEFTPKWGIEVKKALIERNETQGQAAAAIGISRMYFTMVVNGKLQSTGAKKRICDYFGIEQSEIDDDNAAKQNR